MEAVSKESAYRELSCRNWQDSNNDYEWREKDE